MASNELNADLYGWWGIIDPVHLRSH